jgi:VCBS repeat-containing protein
MAAFAGNAANAGTIDATLQGIGSLVLPLSSPALSSPETVTLSFNGTLGPADSTLTFPAGSQLVGLVQTSGPVSGTDPDPTDVSVLQTGIDTFLNDLKSKPDDASVLGHPRYIDQRFAHLMRTRLQASTSCTRRMMPTPARCSRSPACRLPAISAPPSASRPTEHPRSVAAFRSLAFGETAFDSFTYTITDQFGDHTTAKVTVAVVGQVAPPVAGPVSASTNEDTAIGVNVLASVVDPHDGAILSVASLPTTSALGARLTLLADGSVQYDPNTSSKLEALGQGQTATDSFQYVVTNEYGARATGTVTLHVDGVNDAPIAVDHTVSKNANVVSSINVLSGDRDPDTGDVLSVVGVQAKSALGATLTIASDGTVTYDPRSVAALRALARGETATDTFTYTIADEHGATATAKVTVTVVGQNDPPVAVADQGSTSKTAAININVLANDSDVDHGAVLSVVAFSAKSSLGVTLILNADGSITYDPTTSAKLQKLAPGQTVTDTFTYTISDQFGARSSVQCTVTVSGGSPVAASAGTHAGLQPTAQDQPIAVAFSGPVPGDEPDEAISAGKAEPTRAAPVAIEDTAAVALVAGSDVLTGNLDQLDADEVISLHGIDPAQAKSISGNCVMGPTFERAELMAALLASGIRLGTNRKGANGSNPAANQPAGPWPGGPVRGLLLFDACSDQLFSADQDEGHSRGASLQALNNHPGLMRFAESGLHAPDFAFDA